MGQWDPKATGRIHLVESPDDVASLAPSDPAKLAFSTQTTLSVDEAREVIEALRARFPQIEGPRHDDICYATQNRQDAVRELAARVDLVLVIGSPNSSNSNRLRELAEKQGIPAYLIDGPQDIRREWVEGKATVGVTAGASAPESLVQGVVGRLREWGAGEVRDLEGQPENMVFALPKELRLIMVE
jgi:4-hydroxy-3-methylbut-2-enyl diphosphate reductase